MLVPTWEASVAGREAWAAMAGGEAAEEDLVAVMGAVGWAGTAGVGLAGVGLETGKEVVVAEKGRVVGVDWAEGVRARVGEGRGRAAGTAAGGWVGGMGAWVEAAGGGRVVGGRERLEACTGQTACVEEEKDTGWVTRVKATG